MSPFLYNFVQTKKIRSHGFVPLLPNYDAKLLELLSEVRCDGLALAPLPVPAPFNVIPIAVPAAVGVLVLVAAAALLYRCGLLLLSFLFGG